MVMNKLLASLVCFVVLVGMSGMTMAATYTVCSSGCDYTSIQTAINAANDGDKVSVGAGIYNENIEVNKSVNLVGTSAENTTINASNSSTHVISVYSDSVTIRGFTIQGFGNETVGVFLDLSNYCNVSENVLTEVGQVIKLQNANNNSISDNNFTGSIFIFDSDYNKIFKNVLSMGGIFLFSSTSNYISENSIKPVPTYKSEDNVDIIQSGVYCYEGRKNVISGNHISGGHIGIQGCDIVVNNTLVNNPEYGIKGGSLIEGNKIIKSKTGIEIRGLNKGRVRGNIIYDSGWGITLYHSSSNNVTDNAIFSNELEGIAFYSDSDWNFISNNTVNDNRIGIYIDTSSYNEIYENSVELNRRYGIALGAASENLVSRNNVSKNPIGISTFPVSVILLDEFLNEGNILFENDIISNHIGIELRQAKESLVKRNYLVSNRDSGVVLNDSNNNTLYENYIDSSIVGITLNNSFNNSITENSVLDNKIDIYLVESIYNSIQNNTIYSIQYYSKADETLNTIDNNTPPIVSSPPSQNSVSTIRTHSKLILFVIVLLIILVMIYFMKRGD